MKGTSLVKTFIGFAVGPLGAAIINFLTIPIITWLISPEEFGKTSLFLIMQALATAFIFLGMDHAYVREYNNQLNKKELLFNCAIFPLIFSVLICVCLIMFSELFTSLIFTGQSESIIVLFAIWLPFITIERFLLLSIRMEEKGFLYSLFNILIKLMIMLFTLFFLLFWARNYLVVITANVIGQIISDIVLIVYCRNKLELKFQYLEKKLLKKMIKFGLPFIPTAIIMWLLNSTDRMVLEKFSSYDELGVYFAALKIIGVLTIFQSIFSTFWLPIAYKWKKEKVDNREFDKISHYIGFIMSFVFIAILLLKEVFVIILSDKYSEVLYIIPFLLFYPIMYTLGETTGLGISFARKTYYNIWISIVLALLNLVLNLLLVPHFAAIGASIALGITYISYFWCRTLISRKLWYKFDLRYYFILTSILIVVALGNVTIKNHISLFNSMALIILFIFNRKIVANIYKEVKMLILKKGI
ncbi:lipopolysaccharide biosynthesis protein [Bacillus mycoides]|uniref:lipopolysaccharide biosynthesis protein n=1 Tax=Bacillus mycoides TaxID=1405 RepID=UPI003D645C02